VRLLEVVSRRNEIPNVFRVAAPQSFVVCADSRCRSRVFNSNFHVTNLRHLTEIDPFLAVTKGGLWGSGMPLIMEKRVRSRSRESGSSGYDFIGRPMRITQIVNDISERCHQIIRYA